MRRRLVYAGLGVLLVASMGIALAVGSAEVAFSDALRVVGARLGLLDTTDVSATTETIVWQLRLPRVLLAMVTGGGLAVVGVAMQALVRNPLAEPYLLGISSGASAGVAALYLGFLPPALTGVLSFPLAASIGGFLTILLVYLVAREGSTLSVPRLLLAGVAMSAMMGALSSFFTFASPNPDKLRTVLFLLLGSLSGTRWEALWLPTLITAASLGLLLALARPLDTMLLGEEPARSLGMPVELIKRLLLVLSALVTGTLVAATGAIGFVGLIVPHAVRSVLGVRHARLLPASFFAGAVLLVWADLIARTLLPAQELPVGVVTSLCGVPFFLYLLRRGSYRFG